MDRVEEQAPLHTRRPLLTGGREDLLGLSSPVRVLAAAASCEEADAVLRRHPRESSVAVRGATGQVGLLSRRQLAWTLSGPLGYGRVLNGRRPVGEFTDWDPVLVDSATDVVDAAAQLVQHGREHWDDVLVEDPGGQLRVAPAAALLTALAGSYAVRAWYDDLTGLANRALLLDELTARCARTRPTSPAGAAGPRAGAGTCVVVVYLDLDGFKAVNDSAGHNAGDRVLVDVAARLRATSRSQDLLARLGGDEFAVLLELPASPEATAADHGEDLHRRAATAAERFRQALADGPRPVRASVGVAVSSPGHGDAETLLREADLAMYRAKSTGGDRVVVVDRVGEHLTLTGTGALLPDPDTLARRELRRALDQDELRLHYQPIVSIRDGAVASLEALVRWAHPSRGLLPPDQFLPAAARLGLLADLDAWVLERALADHAAWSAALPPASVPRSLNVNLSVAALARTDLYPWVAGALRRHHMHPGRLRLEIVEDAGPELLAAASHQLQQLRADGVSLTWDDMGAGSSSLRHLTQVNVDGLKIDRSFITGLLHDPAARSVVQMLIRLATAMGLTATAEGIETPEQLTALANLGAQYAQGYHLARPTPANDVPRLLTQLHAATKRATGAPLAPHPQAATSGL